MSKFKRYKKEISIKENKSKLDRFLNEEDVKDDSDFNVLIWWKLNSHRFPILSHITRDVLTAPISTAVFKSAFRFDGHMLDTYRSSLTPKLAQALICTQDWLHKSSCFDVILDDLVELEKVDLDKNLSNWRFYLFQFLFSLDKLDIP